MAKFIMHWEEQVRQYHQLVPPTSHIAKEVHMQILQNAVSSVDRLASVKEQADHFAVLQGVSTTYSNYVALLNSAAEQFDKKVKLEGRSAPTRKDYSYDVRDYLDSDIDHGEYSIDTPISTIINNAAMRQKAKMSWQVKSS